MKGEVKVISALIIDRNLIPLSEREGSPSEVAIRAHCILHHSTTQDAQHTHQHDKQPTKFRTH